LHYFDVLWHLEQPEQHNELQHFMKV